MRAGRSRPARPSPTRRSAATPPRSRTACSASGTSCASHADYARTHEAFPSEVADALAFVAAEDVVGYVEAVEEVLESFEARDAYLEDVPVADTVLVLQALAAPSRDGGRARVGAAAVTRPCVLYDGG